MALSKNVPLVFTKPGSGYFETVTSKLCEILYGKGIKMDVKATLVDVKGGNGMFPIYTFMTDKEGTIDLESATFSLSQVGVGSAVQYTTTGLKKNNRVLATLSSTSLGANLTGVSDIKCIASDGSTLAVSQTGTAAATGVDISATGAITWGASVAAGEYVFWFKSDTADAIQAGMLKDAMPEVCSFTWMLPAEELDGDIYQVDLFVKRCRADGAFNIDAQKGTASTPKLTLKILDPGDGTDNFATIVLSKIGTV